MELPYGLTLDEVKEIVDMYDKLYDDIEQGREPQSEFDKDGCMNYDEWEEDDEYIDRYLQIGDAEYCISTEKYDEGKRVDNHYLSETVIISTDKQPEHWFISELRKLVGR